MVSKIAKPSTVLRFGCGWLVLTASFTAAIADDGLTASPPRFSRSEVEALSLARTGIAKVPSNGASQKAMLATNATNDDDVFTALPPPRFSRSEVEALSPARTGSAKVPSNGASQKAMLATNSANEDDDFTALPQRFSRSEVEALSPVRTGSAKVPSNGASQKAMLATNASIAATLAEGSPGFWCGEFRRDAAVYKKNACCHFLSASEAEVATKTQSNGNRSVRAGQSPQFGPFGFPLSVHWTPLFACF
jgi:hypothetical protein